MARPIETNNYRIEGELTYVDVSTKNHPNTWAIIDTDRLGIVIDGRGRWRFMDGYVVRYVNQKRQRLSRLLLGFPPELVDHINRDTLDNRVDNLRPATSAVNIINRAVSSKTGFRGVQQLRSGRYIARIMHEGRTQTIGTFDTAEEAGKAYTQTAKEIHGVVFDS